MKISNFKALSLAVCCSVTALWTEIQGMEQLGDREAPVHNIPYGKSCFTGSIMAFSGNSVPNGCGWLMCDGAPYNSIDYPELYSVIGTKYVSEHMKSEVERQNINTRAKTFYVPDLRGRVIVGVDNGGIRVTSNNTLGASGGVESVAITISQTPFSGSRMDTYINCGGNGPVITDENAKPHNNMQPYTCLNYIINTGQANGQQQNEILQLKRKIDQLENSQQGCAKVWVVFNGSETGPNISILDGFGVSSVIKNSIGTYTVNFSQPFNSVNYCSTFNARGGTNSVAAAIHPTILHTANSFTFQTFAWYPTPCVDASYVSACFFGN